MPLTHKTPTHIEKKVVKLYREGFSAGDISRMGLTTKTTIERILVRNGVRARTRAQAMRAYYKRRDAK